MTLPEILTKHDRHPSWLTRAARQGGIVPRLPGVYLRADVADDPTWRARAALAWRPDVILMGEIAASWTFWRELEVSTIDLVARTDIERAGYRFHRRTIPPHLVGPFGYFQMTSCALTVIDLIGSHGLDVVDHALRSRLVRITDLFTALDATPGRVGNTARRRALIASRTEPWSAAERLAHELLRGAGITGWRSNMPLKLDGQQYYLDMAFREIKLVIEIDGRQTHEKEDIFESDRERQNELVVAGWTVLRFTWSQLTNRPEYVVDTTRRGIRHAAGLQRIRRQIRDRAGSASQ